MLKYTLVNLIDKLPNEFTPEQFSILYFTQALSEFDWKEEFEDVESDVDGSTAKREKSFEVVLNENEYIYFDVSARYDVEREQGDREYPGSYEENFHSAYLEGVTENTTELELEEIDKLLNLCY